MLGDWMDGLPVVLGPVALSAKLGDLRRQEPFPGGPVGVVA